MTYVFYSIDTSLIVAQVLGLPFPEFMDAGRFSETRFGSVAGEHTKGPN
jgi:hypothetical protein